MNGFNTDIREFIGPGHFGCVPKSGKEEFFTYSMPFVPSDTRPMSLFSGSIALLINLAISCCREVELTY
ncbi:hypothetical protein H3S89_10905 [Bartonella sp. B10834G6]|uniref:hypothetical protein n=1 Tax=Bartonella apis TaxID=1686310 RepID=UPI0018DCAA69|nr:hypothetical protein [Bartonella apis]MBH9983293.1 hypothetical protein [Bartonella apis]